LGEKKVLKLQALQKFLNENQDHNVPQKLIEETDRLNKISIKEMTVADVNILTDVLSSLRSQSTLKKNIIAKQKNRTVRRAADDFVEELKTTSTPAKEIRPGVPAQKGGLLNKFKLATLGLESIAEEIDKGKIGIASDVLFRNTVKVGQEARQRANDAVSEFVKSRMKEIGIDGRDVAEWSQPIKDSESAIHKTLRIGGRNFAHKVGPKAKSLTVDLDSGQKITMTYGEAAKLYRLSKNEKAMKNLIDTEKGGIRLAEAEHINYKLTPADLEKIFSELPPEVKSVADITHEYENTIQSKAINKTSQERVGVDLAREKDYVKAQRSSFDKDKGVQVGKGTEDAVIDQALDNRGFLIEKTNVRAPLVIRDEFSEFYNSARNVNHYVGMAEPMAIAKAFIGKPNVRTAITAEFGKNTVTAIDKALREIENPPRPSDQFIPRIVDKARSNIVKAVLGAGGVAGGVVAKQPVSYITAATEIDSRHLAAALVDPLPSKIEIAKSNAILGSRLQTGRFERDVGPSDNSSNFWTGRTGLADKLMAPTSAADALAIRRIWAASKREVLEKNPNATLAEIGARAEEVTRKTQPTFNIEDRSAVGRDQNVLTKLATSFTSQLNKNAQMLIRSVNQYNGSGKTLSDKATLAKTMSLVAIVSPFLIASIDELRDGLLEATGVRKKKDKDSVAARLAMRTLQNNLGSIYLAGPVVSSAIDKAQGKFMGGEGINNIVSANLSNLSKGAGGLVKDAVEGEWDKNSIRDANKLMISINNMVTGLPIGPLQKTGETALKGFNIIEREDIPSTTGRKRNRSRSR